RRGGDPRALRLAPLPRRSRLPPERDGAARAARARPPRAAPRARRAHPRADAGHPSPSRRQRGDANGPHPRPPGRPRRQPGRGRRVTHTWGGPIDVSPTHLPIFGSRGSVHHGFGFTGNGVGPTYLGGEILARLALDRRDERTGLAIVEPPRKLFPPEPFRYVG